MTLTMLEVGRILRMVAHPDGFVVETPAAPPDRFYVRWQGFNR
jgi:hypothetical protein